MKAVNVDIIKQNETADNIVKTSTPCIFFNDSCISAGILSGKGQLSSQSMQLQAVVLFCNSKCLISYIQ